MKETYIQILDDILNEIDYRVLKLSINRFNIKQFQLKLKKKRGPLSKQEIEYVEKLYDEFIKELEK